MKRTKVTNIDDALDVIEHVNEDHTNELKAIILCLFPNRVVEHAKLVELFEEGALVGVYRGQSSERDDIFVPFEIEGTISEKLFHLAYAYSDPDQAQKEIKRFLTVTDIDSLTDNFTRITFRNERPFTEQWPGLCFSVHLKILKQLTSQKARSGWFSDFSASVYKSVSLLLMKLLPIRMRRNMIEKSRKDVRAYTLRDCWEQSINGDTQFFGTLDVFTHGTSPGSRWANSLQVGDTLFTSGDHLDKHPALAQDNCVIFCDETAYPAAAGLLEQWQNDIPPTLIILSQQQTEQGYFNTVDLPKDTKVITIVCAYEQQADKVIDVLNNLSHFDTVWGAMEMNSAKQVRHHLRNNFKLKGQNNLVKPYWRSDKTEHDS
jgi:NADPH-dependent ferric siderophore reductase